MIDEDRIAPRGSRCVDCGSNGGTPLVLDDDGKVRCENCYEDRHDEIREQQRPKRRPDPLADEIETIAQRLRGIDRVAGDGARKGVDRDGAAIAHDIAGAYWLGAALAEIRLAAGDLERIVDARSAERRGRPHAEVTDADCARALEEAGSLRGAARLLGTSERTVRRRLGR